MRIGVLTSGGDCPGLNAAIVAVSRALADRGVTPLGVPLGYAGLIELAGATKRVRQEMLVDLRHLDATTLVREGGTVLQTRRLSVHKDPAALQAAVLGVERAGLDGLVVIGGDGSLQGAAALDSHGVLTVGVPKTIDRDVTATDETIGFATATEVGCELVERIMTTARSHGMSFLVEVMGRRAGHLAAAVARASMADGLVVPEAPLSYGALRERFEELGGGSVVVIAEGCWPADLPVPAELADRAGKMTLGDAARTLEKALIRDGVTIRSTRLGYAVRGGRPVAQDRLLALELGTRAGEVAGLRSGLVVRRGGRVAVVPIAEAGLGRRLLGVDELEAYADILWR